MPKYQSYIICTSPRSGSTLLCKLLTATGVCGNPGSYFYDQSIAGWLDYFGIEQDGRRPEHDTLKLVFQAAIAKGTLETGLFGLRQQRQSFDFFMEKLAVLHPGLATDKDRLEAAFGRTLFIHLTRPDKVDQAISWVMAEQTGLWHRAPEGHELERLAPPADPVYDAGRIRAAHNRVTRFDQDWARWFDEQNIQPLQVIYADLAADPPAVLKRILVSLGLDTKAANGVVPAVAKLSDATNLDWADRFRNELQPG